jgi:hypothetical protein
VGGGAVIFKVTNFGLIFLSHNVKKVTLCTISNNFFYFKMIFTVLYPIIRLNWFSSLVHSEISLFISYFHP